MKTKTVSLKAKYGSGKIIKIKVPESATAPYLLTSKQNERLRVRAKLVMGDYFENVDVGY